ncbi:MAG: hypothetical protein J3K34DRAFT_527019, partial [Monoraphidium minutum]
MNPQAARQARPRSAYRAPAPTNAPPPPARCGALAAAAPPGAAPDTHPAPPGPLHDGVPVGLCRRDPLPLHPLTPRRRPPPA